MGESLAVNLTILWVKSWEPELKLQTPKSKTSPQFSTCRNCEHRVTDVPGVLKMKYTIDGSTKNFSKSLTQNMIAEKTSFRCAHSAVKMITLTLTIRPKQKFS